MNDTLDIGDEAILSGNFRPKYLRNAIVQVKNIEVADIAADCLLLRRSDT